MASVDPKKPHILLATTATGSVTATSFTLLCREVSKFAEVKVIATEPAVVSIDRQVLPNDIPLYTDEDQWSNWKKVGDTELHDELCQWADILVIAPLSADSLAKIALGLCDDFVTYMVRAWGFSKPIFVAPSMNKTLWQDRFTEQHLKIIVDDLGISLIPPILEGRTSRDYGTGEMAEISVICETIFVHLIRCRVESVQI